MEPQQAPEDGGQAGASPGGNTTAANAANTVGAADVGAPGARTSLANTWMAWVVAFSTAAATGPAAAMGATCPTPAGPANMVVVLAPVPYYSWNQCERALPSPDMLLARWHRKQTPFLRVAGKRASTPSIKAHCTACAACRQDCRPASFGRVHCAHVICALSARNQLITSYLGTARTEGNDLANTGHPTEPINETNHAGITLMCVVCR